MKDEEFEEKLKSLSKMYTLRREVKERIMRRVRGTELSKRSPIGVIIAILVSLIVLIIIIPSPSYITDPSYTVKESEFVEKIMFYLENVELFQWLLIQVFFYLITIFLGLSSIILINRLKLKGGKR